MPRADAIPECPQPPAARSSERLTREYLTSLITPLFGGGVEAGKTDESLPIRGTSIRGQLQFWWRATRGARFANHHDLSEHHAEIWGATEKASPVEVVVGNAAPAHCYAALSTSPKIKMMTDFNYGGFTPSMAVSCPTRFSRFSMVTGEGVKATDDLFDDAA